MAAHRREAWRTFEDVVRALVDWHRDFFGLEAIEPGPGTASGQSGYVWDIEVIGYTAVQRKRVIFEVRRKTSRNVVPAEVADLAYRIDDTGAEKGYFVTPMKRGLSRGAKTIADFEHIGHIQVSVDSTPDDYLMRAVDQVFLGVTETFTYKEVVEIEKRDQDGTIRTDRFE